MDARWVTMLNGRGAGFRASMPGRMFQWAASKSSAAEIERARHAPELQTGETVYWRLDARATYWMSVWTRDPLEGI